MQRKLTLRLDENLIQRAKSYSERAGKSISQIVADYFALLDGEPVIKASELTPMVRSLKGSLKGAKVDESDYRRHLEDKYL